MQQTKKTVEPDNTAVRTALWRALHLEVDATPHIIEDETGLKLIAPNDGWQQRPDMKYTKRLRASVVARARFIEDVIIEESKKGISQYVILGAGLDTFAQRQTAIASQLEIFEIDQPDTQTWKQQRLMELGFNIPGNLHFVPVDFEISSWFKALTGAGFNTNKPAVISCTGVSLYLTKKVIISTLKQMATLAPHSTLAMSFYLSTEFLEEEDKALMEMSIKGAAASGTPMLSFFSPDEIMLLANKAGFKKAKTVSTKDMEQLYFTNRTDNLLPASGEIILVAST